MIKPRLSIQNGDLSSTIEVTQPTLGTVEFEETENMREAVTMLGMEIPDVADEPGWTYIASLDSRLADNVEMTDELAEAAPEYIKVFGGCDAEFGGALQEAIKGFREHLNMDGFTGIVHFVNGVEVDFSDEIDDDELEDDDDWDDEDWYEDL